MKWNTEITNKGAELIAQAVVSGDIVFTRSVGSSALSGATDLKTVTEISEPQYDLGLKSIETNGKSVRITVRLLNDGVDKPYTIKQVGIYGKLKDETDEVLISVSESSTGETVPSTATVPEWVCDLVIVLNMENSISPTIVISSGIYANIDHKHSKDDIEDLPEISGENLLDNPDFKINQRGQSEYTAAGYTVDRWTINTGSVTVNDTNGIVLTNNSSAAMLFRQYLDIDFSRIAGKNLSLSVCIDGTIYTGSGIVPSEKPAEITQIIQIAISDNIAANLTFSPSKDAFDLYLYVGIGASSTISWVKVEPSSIATLFVPPDPATELLKIQSMNDDGTPKLISSNALPAIMNSQMVSNPNLLDNPDFKINQRGLGQYSCNSTKFCVDRWYTFKQNVSTAGTITINENGLKLKSGGTRLDTYLAQTISNKNALVGKTVTLSFEISEIVGSFMVGRYGDNSSIKVVSTSGIIQHTFSWLPSSDTMPDRILFYNNSADFSCIIKWVKLEVGSIATPFISPNPTEELLKIQSMDNSGGVKIASNDTLPTIMNSEMVSNPNLLVNPDFKINQRGLHTYSTLGNGVAVPFSDGWFVYPTANDVASKVTVQLGEEYNISYEWDSGDSLKAKTIYQRIVPVNFNLRIGEPLIASAKISSSTVNVKIDVVIYSDFMEPNYIISTPVTTYNNSQNGIIISTISEIPREAKLLEFRITTVSSVSESGNFNVVWAKLEYGSVPTKFVAPNYAEELLKIQSMNDDGSTKLISNEMLPSIMNSQMVSNPNLLINPNFKINQRGITSVAGGNDRVYFADRWHSVGCSVTNTAGVVSAAWDGSYIYDDGTNMGYIQSVLELPELIGKQVTLSINIDGVRHHAVFTIPTTFPGIVRKAVIEDIDIAVGNYVNMGIAALLFLKSTTSHIIGDVKLEIGGNATPFVPPDPAEELFKIQSMYDDGAPKLVSNGNLPTIMNSEMVSNPNLLDNPDFRINQRGQSEYASDGYTVDRWQLSTISKLTPNDGYVTFKSTVDKTTPTVFQIVKNPSALSGKTVTLSFDCDLKTEGAYITIQTVTNGSWNPSPPVGLYDTGRSVKSTIINLPNNLTDLRAAMVIHGTDDAPLAAVDIYGAKLEIGNIPTQFVAPKYADELLKIQSMGDDGAPKLLSNDALPTIMNSQMVSNPNLLDNPDFKINQRGQSEYSQSAKGQKMTIDRWAIYKHSSTETGDITITPNSSGGVVLNNQTDGKACMYQRIENFSDLFGKQVTYSASINGTILSLTATCTNASSQMGNVIYTDDKSAYLRIWAVLDSYIQFEIYLNAGTSITVDWAKVEIGGTPTPFIPPNPALELEKCQRYLWVLRSTSTSNIILGRSLPSSSTSIEYYLYSPVELRSVPTIAFENITLQGSTSAGITFSKARSIAVRRKTSNIILLQVTTNASMTTGAWYVLSSPSGSVGMIELSSEI